MLRQYENNQNSVSFQSGYFNIFAHFIALMLGPTFGE